MRVMVILYFPHLRAKMCIEQGIIFIPKGDDFPEKLRNIAAIDGRWLGSWLSRYIGEISYARVIAPL